MMQAAKLNELHLEPASVRALVRFMVYAEPYSDATMRLLRRIHKDKNHPKTLIEVVAVTRLLMQRDKELHSLCQFTAPLYIRSDYLDFHTAAKKEVQHLLSLPFPLYFTLLTSLSIHIVAYIVLRSSCLSIII